MDEEQRRVERDADRKERVRAKKAEDAQRRAEHEELIDENARLVEAARLAQEAQGEAEALQAQAEAEAAQAQAEAETERKGREEAEAHAAEIGDNLQQLLHTDTEGSSDPFDTNSKATLAAKKESRKAEAKEKTVAHQEKKDATKKSKEAEKKAAAARKEKDRGLIQQAQDKVNEKAARALEKKKAAEAAAKQDAKKKEREKERRRAEAKAVFSGNGKKRSKGKKGDSSSDSGSDTDDTESSSERKKKKKRRKAGKRAQDDTSTDSDTDSDSDSDASKRGKRGHRRNSSDSDEPRRKKRGGHEKRREGHGWRRALGSSNAKNSRFEKSEFRNWKKRDAHRKEAAVVFDENGKGWGVYELKTFKAVSNIDTLATEHPPLVTQLRKTHGSTVDRLMEVLGTMKKPGPFPTSAQMNIATDGPVVKMLVAIHRCIAQSNHTKTVNQIFHAIDSPPSEWGSKITDVESNAIETPITKTALGYAGSAYTANPSTVTRDIPAAPLIPRGGLHPRGGFRGGRGGGATETVTPATPQAAPVFTPRPLHLVPQGGCNNCDANGHWGRDCPQLCRLPPCVAAVAGIRADVKHTGAMCPLRQAPKRGGM